ncbi:hypothetical protein NXS13_04905 [Corynebacterium sp. ES2730-CONJ]|uniref:Rv1157c family protein n=1 Tax=Corynebacterium sp. ES2730-CONJ TaxID=2973941 RepID=UPI00216AD508|nr:hypothetical protein [Corynebacterium sp. ES2730-CONJ]MCS4531847.1 hypothetical protein [Corynebacterium sp. ES2730-CONJ]
MFRKKAASLLVATAGLLIPAALGPVAHAAEPALSSQSHITVPPAIDLSQYPAWPIDNLGRPKAHLLDQAATFAQSAPLPDMLRTAIMAGVGFFKGEGKPGVDLPADGPRFFQFGWPTVARSCIGGELDSVGSAIAVPGPASLPLPGVADGETAFVFTALGTGTLDRSDMRVRWFNLSTLTSGEIILDQKGINPEGPATATATAPTGRGHIVAVMDGGMSTIEGESATYCTFAPTSVAFEVK